MNKKRIFQISTIFLCLAITPKLFATTQVWLVIGPPSTQPSLNSEFVTKLCVSSWNGIPAALDFTIHHNPNILEIDNISIPNDSPFHPNCFIDSTSVDSGKTHIACFQLSNSIKLDTLVTFGIIRWKVKNLPDSTTDISLNVSRLVEKQWNPVAVFPYGQHINFTPVTNIENLNNGLPTTYDLENNYPNPFNPTTVIRYQVPEKTAVTLKIYNILGQQVKTLVNERKLPGYYSIQWQGDNDSDTHVSSGIYIYRMIAGSFIKSKTMVLVR